MLHSFECRRQSSQRCVALSQLFRGYTRRSHERVQFIDGPVAFDAQIVLGYFLAADETRFTAISHPRVDSVQRDPRFIESLFTHVRSFALSE